MSTLSWVARNVSDEETGFSHCLSFCLLAKRSTSLNHSTSQENNNNKKTQKNHANRRIAICLMGLMKKANSVTALCDLAHTLCKYKTVIEQPKIFVTERERHKKW